MSGINTKTNEGRVQRMLETLDHLETSFRSNRASAADAAALLRPVLDRLAVLTGETTQAPGTPPSAAPAASADAPASPRPKGERPARWADLRQFVMDLDPHDLAEALSLIAVRIDDVVFEKHGSRFAPKPKTEKETA